jgi:ATP-dependent Clp protease ATP-binding subunit ClpC
MGRGDQVVQGEIGLTSRAKRVVELAVEEARHPGHHYPGTEHLLLGMLREGEGIGAEVLKSFGLSAQQVRAKTLERLHEA